MPHEFWHNILCLTFFTLNIYIYLRKKPHQHICLFYSLYYWGSLILVFPRKMVMLAIAAWKERHNLDTDPQTSTSKQTSCAKHTFGFLHHRHQRNEHQRKSHNRGQNAAPCRIYPVAVTSPFDRTGQEIPQSWRDVSAPSHPWVIQDEGVKMAKVHASPFYVPIQTPLHEGPCSVRLPGRMPPSPSAPRLHLTSTLSAPAASQPQPNRRPRVSTLFRHNPQAPLKSAPLFRLKVLGLQHWKTRLRLLWLPHHAHHCAGEVGAGGFVKWWPGDDHPPWHFGKVMCV